MVNENSCAPERPPQEQREPVVPFILCLAVILNGAIGFHYVSSCLSCSTNEIGIHFSTIYACMQCYRVMWKMWWTGQRQAEMRATRYTKYTYHAPFQVEQRDVMNIKSIVNRTQNLNVEFLKELNCHQTKFSYICCEVVLLTEIFQEISKIYAKLCDYQQRSVKREQQFCTDVLKTY